MRTITIRHDIDSGLTDGETYAETPVELKSEAFKSSF